jgi:hypothetical protein
MVGIFTLGMNVNGRVGRTHIAPILLVSLAGYDLSIEHNRKYTEQKQMLGMHEAEPHKSDF